MTEGRRADQFREDVLTPAGNQDARQPERRQPGRRPADQKEGAGQTNPLPEGRPESDIGDIAFEPAQELKRPDGVSEPMPQTPEFDSWLLQNPSEFNSEFPKTASEIHFEFLSEFPSELISEFTTELISELIPELILELNFEFRPLTRGRLLRSEKTYGFHMFLASS